MTFVSIEFLVLFLFTALIFYRCNGNKPKQILLLGVSYIFYAWWDVRFLLLLIIQTYICYFLAAKIQQESRNSIRKRYCIVGVIISLLILGFFKYYNFFMETLKNVFQLKRTEVIYIILPIGISFYTFQAISYLIDVYRMKIEAREEYIKVALYISFFPQLVAGPIVRAEDFLPQCDEEHWIKKKNVEVALQIFLFGLFKKVVIADRLAVCVDSVFAVPNAYDTVSVIMAVFSYSIQIYCDFSGYSDMAIAIARFFGYDLCKNFDVPYISRNPSEFWKRWHISLSSWLLDYLYIPLGGNRKGRCRTYINLIFTMILGGLWHGASWHFVIWGGLHGIALAVHKLFREWKSKRCHIFQNKWVSYMSSTISMIMTYCFVTICWIFFRTQDLTTAYMILKRMFHLYNGIHYIYIFSVVYGLLVFGVHMIVLKRNSGNGYYPIIDLSKFRNKFLLCLLIWIIVIFSYDGDNAFIYFQF